MGRHRASFWWSAACCSVLSGAAALVVLADGRVPSAPRARAHLAEVHVPAAVRAGTTAHPKGWSLDTYLSPLTPEVVAHLRDVASRADRRDDVFAKVGDSATVNRGFMRCFAHADEVDLGDWPELADTAAFFRQGNAGGIDPYRRDSVAAKVGWSAHNVLRGHPSALLREVYAVSPRFALVMFGTNDIENHNLRVYADRMLAIVDALTARGVIPILSNVIPRNDDPDADRVVPRYGRIVEAIARSRQVPWINLHDALVGLPERGLMSDGVHPSTFIEGNELRGCDFGPEGRKFGQNMRNLLTLRMLDRLRHTVLDGGAAPDPSRSGPVGEGTPEDPVRIDGLPLAVVASTASGAEKHIDRYPGCDSDADESGPERVFRFHVAEPTRVRVQALYDHHVDVDVHLLGAHPTGGGCVARADTELVRDVPAGTFHIAVDTYVPDGGSAAPGEFVLLVEPAPNAEPAAD